MLDTEVVIRVTLVINGGVTVSDLVLSVFVCEMCVAMFVVLSVLFKRLVVVGVTVVVVLYVLIGTVVVAAIVV